MKRIKRFYVLSTAALLFLSSCGDGEQKNLTYYDNEDAETEETETKSSDVIVDSPYGENCVAVPFSEQGGVKLIDVKVNDQFTVDMIIDSGCSGTLISISEANYLYEKGCISAEDILGTSQAQIADGSIVEDLVINLRKLEIGGQIVCEDVEATVSSNANAPLLLGNEVLNRATSYKVDNKNKVIIFNLD